MSARRLWIWLLPVVSFVYYIVPAVRAYNQFHLQTFDYGIFFQGNSLLLYSDDLFLRSLGRHVFADHQRWIQFPLSLLNLTPHPHLALLIVCATGVWSAGFALFLYFKEPSLRLSVPILVWLSPLMVNMSGEVAHPECLATVFILLCFIGVRSGSLRCFWSGLILAVCCKEDVALTVMPMMILLAIFDQQCRVSKKCLLWGAVVALTVFVIDLGIVLPVTKHLTCRWMQSGIDTSTDLNPAGGWFRNLTNNVFDSTYWLRILSSPSVKKYMLLVYWPLIPVFFCAPWVLLLPFTAVAINIISGSPYLVAGYYHYDHSSFAAVVIAVIICMERIPVKVWFATVIAVSVTALNLFSSAGSIRVRISALSSSEFWNVQKLENVKFFEHLNRELPISTSISADFRSMSYFLGGRRDVYMFPNPLESVYFGIQGLCTKFENPPAVDLILVGDFVDLYSKFQDRLADYDINGEFRYGDIRYYIHVHRNAPTAVRELISKELREGIGHGKG